jgi:hypothetical protein
MAASSLHDEYATRGVGNMEDDELSAKHIGECCPTKSDTRKGIGVCRIPPQNWKRNPLIK